MHIFLTLIVLIAAMPLHAYGDANGGDRVFKLANMDPVLFSHDYHTKTRGINCRACHNQEFLQAGSEYQMKHEKITKKDFCRHCHNGMKGFDAKSDKNCIRCHKK